MRLGLLKPVLSGAQGSFCLAYPRYESDQTRFEQGQLRSDVQEGGVPLQLTLPFRSPPPRASACGPRNYFDETRACTYGNHACRARCDRFQRLVRAQTGLYPCGSSGGSALGSRIVGSFRAGREKRMRERPQKVSRALKSTSEYVKRVKISISESRPENPIFIGKVHAHEAGASETSTIRSAGVVLLSLSAIRVRSDTFRAGSTSIGRTGGGGPTTTDPPL